MDPEAVDPELEEYEELEEFDVELDAYDHLELAYGLEEDEAYEDALVECDSALDLGRKLMADAYNLRGIILEEMDRHREAVQAYSHALEIEPGFTEAAENLRDLQLELEHLHEPITIAVYDNPIEAHVARGRLEVEGIWSHVGDELAATTIGPLAAGGFRLQVRAEDLAQAINILGIEIEEEDDDEEWDDELESDSDSEGE